jgi:tetratricopeptide (TPR) repeat protein
MPARFSPPPAVDTRMQRGVALHRQGDVAGADRLYREIIAEAPDYFDALQLAAMTAAQLGRLAEAERLFARAVSIDPDHAGALNNHGTVLKQLKRFDEALASYDRALALRPNAIEALCNRGIVLRELQRFDEALASYDRALELRPDYADALNSRGVALRELGRFDEALANADRALAIRPGFAEALVNRGTSLIELRRLDEALASFQRAQAIRPDYADAHWSESLCRLLAGDFPAGWAKHEWRWRTDAAAGAKREFTQTLWLGEQEVTGKSVLLHAEQGFGDTIQFCRYATLLAQRGARVVLEVQPALCSLLSGLAGVERVVARGDALPEFDFHCPLLSLPLAFRTTLETIPALVPYLAPSPSKVDSWRARVPAGGTKIGLAWSGSRTHGNDCNRSITPDRLAPLLECGATVVSLQKELCDDDRQWLAAHPEVRHFGDNFSSFADTAALISLLDVVISVDTAVAHLAGAMGRPVWILLPVIGVDWRWMLGREDSPWYPSARLFRQCAIGGWDAVVERIAAELRARFRGGHPSPRPSPSRGEGEASFPLSP